MKTEVKEIKKESPEFTRMTNLASERVGSKAVACTDDFFATMHNLVKPGRGVFIEGKYTENGKWMDGWESRRKRTSGHDWCIIKLGVEGRIHGLDIDTNHFLGNHPPYASLYAINSKEEPTSDANWVQILPKSHLDAGSQNFFKIDNPEIWTHVKLDIFPDGGVARLKVYGEVFKNWEEIGTRQMIDLVSVEYGGLAVRCNDMFFSDMQNLIMPGRGINMGDGWETKRNRTPNNVDWVILKLGTIGNIEKILVDTCHFKGNYPDSCSLEATFIEENQEVTDSSIEWVEILPPQKLQADHEHVFESEITRTGAFNHVRLKIYPDGGVSRLRVFGYQAGDGK